MVEFVCDGKKYFRNKPKVDVPSSRPPDMSNQDWYGISRRPWFHVWTRPISIEHFVSPQFCGGTAAREADIIIDLKESIPLIINRFGLVPRVKPTEDLVMETAKVIPAAT